MDNEFPICVYLFSRPNILSYFNISTVLGAALVKLRHLRSFYNHAFQKTLFVSILRQNNGTDESCFLFSVEL